MKKALLILALLMVCGNAFAQLEEATTEKEVVEKAVCHYVYLDRQSPVTNTVKGQNEKGDVIDVIPCADITPPEWDFKNFDIIKMSLTKTQALELIKPLVSSDKSLDGNYIIEKERAVKINTDQIQKAEFNSLGNNLYEQEEIKTSIIVKPLLSTTDK